MKWDSFLHFMTYFDISIILSSHNFCEASWVGWQLSGPTCGHTLDTAVSTVTTEQQCLVPGTMCRQYTELFICQKQPGEIMTINICSDGWKSDFKKCRLPRQMNICCPQVSREEMINDFPAANIYFGKSKLRFWNRCVFSNAFCNISFLSQPKSGSNFTILLTSLIKQ